MRTILTHVLFITLVVTAGLLSVLLNMPGEWYATLEKPFFQPPAWLFGPVWTALYILIGLAGARIWLRAPRSAAMQLWFGQFALNMLWSPAFFGMKMPVLALAVILPMWLTILLYIMKARPIDQIASIVFLPYLAWVSFASILNFSIILLN